MDAKQIQEIILAKDGEIALKGQNKGTFEDILIKNIRRRLKPVGHFQITRAQSTIYIQPLEENIDLDLATEKMEHIFGLAAFSRAAVCPKDFEQIKALAPLYLANTLNSVKSFKVEAKRADKRFPMTSPEISRELGGWLLENFPHLEVDVHNPQATITVEIREQNAYIHDKKIPGAGGMPVSSSGKAAILISGGIDSPVAAYMMAKRGLELTAIHFFSPPYTSERAKIKVLDLLNKLSAYCGRIKLVIVPFTQIQEEIKDKVPEELFTIIMRRFMMRISEQIALQQGCGALITGESVGQVASQTLGALACTDEVCTMPVFRPVIGMDKEEIVAVSRKIGTFEISIQPFEDCCTVFTPRHPRTKPKVEFVRGAEEKLNVQALVDKALEQLQQQYITPEQ